MTVREPQAVLSRFALAFVFLLLLTTCLVNLNGGDWDGTQIALGSMFPEPARAGHVILYSYKWQPLTYHILRATYEVTGNPEIVMFLPALFGAAGMLFLMGAMHQLGRGRLSILALLALLLLIPEVIFESVYMNSTVFGFPFASLAAWLACPDWTQPHQARRGVRRHFIVGLLLATATLCRFDYLLAYPMFLFLLARARPARWWPSLVTFATGSLLVIIPAVIAGMTGPAALLDRVAQHHGGSLASGAFHRTGAERLAFTLIGVSPLLWLIAAVAGAAWLAHAIARRRWFDALAVLPLAILLYPVPSLCSPKYLVPFYLFVALFAAWSLGQTPERIIRHPASRWALVGVLIVACFVPCKPVARPPFIRPMMQAAYMTADGPRAFSGYAHTLRFQSTRFGPPTWLRLLLEERRDLLIVGPFDGWIASVFCQRVMLHLARNCADTTLGPGTFVGRRGATKLVLSDPSRVEENLQTHFPAENRQPVRADVPLPFTEAQVRVLRLLATGVTTKDRLAALSQLDETTLETILMELRHNKVADTAEPGHYELRYQLPQLNEPNGTDPR